jgi:hypothetical protein
MIIRPQVLESYDTHILSSRTLRMEIVATAGPCKRLISRIADWKKIAG